MPYESRSIIKLAKPLCVKDASGNEYTLRSCACTVNVSGDWFYLNPDMHQAREGVIQTLSGQDSASMGPGMVDPFTVAIKDDERLSQLMADAVARAEEIVAGRLAAAAAQK